MEIARDALVATSVGICGKKLYHKVKNWYYHKEDIEIKDIHIEFIPQTTEDEMVIITRKGKEPELFKYFSQIK
jgi:H2-forming N5,N10-methylenetetrahydromethanopterin dehydrogenase-like enzyme